MLRTREEAMDTPSLSPELESFWTAWQVMALEKVIRAKGSW